MEGFKSNPKMRSDLPCFKEGGYVTKKQLVAYEKKEDAAEEKKDVSEDKKIVKKAFSMHDKQSHEGEKTDLSKLKKGGRAKKEKGTVKKYARGGWINDEPDDATVAPKKIIPRKRKPVPTKPAAPIPGVGQFPTTGLGGMGNAYSTDGMGQAAPSGPASDVEYSQATPANFKRGKRV